MWYSCGSVRLSDVMLEPWKKWIERAGGLHLMDSWRSDSSQSHTRTGLNYGMFLRDQEVFCQGL